MGGKTLFLSRPFPFIICKFYHPSVVRERFGYDAREIVQILYDWGYRVNVLTRKGSIPVSVNNCYDVFKDHDYGFPLLAWREDD